MFKYFIPIQALFSNYIKLHSRNWRNTRNTGCKMLTAFPPSYIPLSLTPNKYFSPLPTAQTVLHGVVVQREDSQRSVIWILHMLGGGRISECVSSLMTRPKEDKLANIFQKAYFFYVFFFFCEDGIWHPFHSLSNCSLRSVSLSFCTACWMASWLVG